MICQHLVLWRAPDGIAATAIPEGLYKELQEEEDVAEATKLFHKYRSGDYLEQKRNPEFEGTFGRGKHWPFNDRKIKGTICL